MSSDEVQADVCSQFSRTGTCKFGDNCSYDHDMTPVTASARKKRTRSKRKQYAQNAARATHLDEFFAKYPRYSYDRSRPVMEQFYELCDEYGWGKDHPEKDTARLALKDAMTLQFNAIYGTNENDITAWQGLCQVLSISPVPSKLSECRAAVKSTHVNLVDLVDSPGDEATTFRSEADLSAYTKDTGKFFPKENAYAGGLLKHLLRQIANPNSYQARGGGSQGKFRRGRRDF